MEFIIDIDLNEVANLVVEKITSGTDFEVLKSTVSARDDNFPAAPITLFICVKKKEAK